MGWGEVSNESIVEGVGNVSAMYLTFSYMMVVGDVRCCDRDGMSDFRMFACCFGLFLV